MTATYNSSNSYRNHRCVSGNQPGGISGGGAGGVPPSALVIPTVQIQAISGNNTTQPQISGTRMRLARFVQKPRAPSL